MEVSNFSRPSPWLHLGTLSPLATRGVLFLFAARPRVRSSCAQDNNYATCAQRARPLRVCAPAMNLPNLTIPAFGSLVTSPSLWFDVQFTVIGPAARYTFAQVRQESPSPAPADQATMGINQPPSLPSLDPWSLGSFHELRRVQRVARELVLVCNTGPGYAKGPEARNSLSW